MKNKTKIVLKIVLGFSIFLVFFFGLGQLFIKPTSAELSLWNDQPLAQNSNCNWLDNYTFHPFLGMILKSSGPCQIMLVNKQGFHSEKDFDSLDRHTFNILLVGGSVANQLYSLRTPPENGVHLNKCLNEKFKAPGFKKIEVQNASIPSTGQPVQLITWILYGRYFDALISVEGYNEIGNYLGKDNSLDTIILPLYIQMIQNLNQGTGYVRRLAKEMKDFFKSISFLKNSTVAIKIYSIIVKSYYRDSSELNLLTEKYKEEISFNKLNNYSDEEFFRRYKDRLLNLSYLIRSTKKPFFVALQPIPALGKNLKNDEMPFAIPFTVKPYLTLEKQMFETLSDQNFISYKNIFEKSDESLYIDQIHTNDLGTKVFVEKLCEDLGQKFKFTRINN